MTRPRSSERHAAGPAERRAAARAAGEEPAAERRVGARAAGEEPETDRRVGARAAGEQPAAERRAAAKAAEERAGARAAAEEHAGASGERSGAHGTPGERQAAGRRPGADAAPPGEAPGPAAGLLAALSHPRYEVLPLGGIVDEVQARLPKDVKVTVTASPTKGLETTLDTAEALAARGYEVVPHLSARLVKDEAHLDEIVRRLTSAHIDDVFVIAGDARQPAGEFPDAIALLKRMHDLKAGFTHTGISGYPESHHLISDETTIEAMFAKAPMATYIVSQICFDPGTIATWVKRVRDRGTHLPIWIGVPGAVDNRKLVRTSLRIGLGESARFLGTHKGWFRRLALRRRYEPTGLLEELEPTFDDPPARLGGIHVYTFNELERTERWRHQLIDRLETRR